MRVVRDAHGARLFLVLHDAGPGAAAAPLSFKLLPQEKADAIQADAACADVRRCLNRCMDVQGSAGHTMPG